jgi:hypothetical protein
MNKQPAGRKRGRPVDPILRDLRETYPLWSERTRARFKAAIERCQVLGATPEIVAQKIREATRKSGTLNVDLLERYTRRIFEQCLSEKGGGDGC